MSFLSDGYWFARSQFWRACNCCDVYLRYPDFKQYLKAFRSQYRSCSPFALVREYFNARGERMSAVYGETPLRTLATLAKECELTGSDHVVDLGCGRGAALFFLSHLTGCKGLGVDLIPLFIEKARVIQSQAAISLPVEFLCEDYFSVDLSKATCIYLYGTCLEDEQIKGLIRSFDSLLPMTKIVTVSYPLSDYSQDFRVHKSWKGEFAWGSTDFYLQYKNRPLQRAR